MDISPVYILSSAGFRIISFFRHWYVESFRFWSHRAMNTLEGLDQTWALRLTIKYFFHPLFGDYTITGRILGVIFRGGRIVIASFIYLAVVLIYLTLYAIWLLIPVYVIFRIIL